MIETAFKQFVKKTNFRLIFLVLVGLFISETGFAQKRWNSEYVEIALIAQKNCIIITTGVYDYLYGPNLEHGFLDYCKFEASVNNVDYFTLMEIHTPWQLKTKKTAINFKKKHDKALIIFLNLINAPADGLVWPDYLHKHFNVKVPNYYGDTSAVGIKWNLNQEFKDVRYIRISGRWQVVGLYAEPFRVVYDLNLH